MRERRYIVLFICLLCLSLPAGCGGGGGGSSKPSGKTDEQLIQESLTETITRWHYGDKAALYDNEFEYAQNRFTFDDYLKFGQTKLNADTVDAIVVKKAEVFGQDSALVDVDIVFKGPTGKVSHQSDKFHMFYHRGRWIRPTISMFALQREYESSRRAADSAAEAEAKELEGK